MAQTIQAPDGRTWVVRRHWAPRLGVESLWSRFRHRFRWGVRRAEDVTQFDPSCAELIGEGFATAVAVTFVVLLVVFVAFPLLAAVIEIAVVVLLAAAGVLGRVLLRRPWTVEARASDGTTQEWRVPGWRASGRWRSDVEERLALGRALPLAGTATGCL